VDKFDKGGVGEKKVLAKIEWETVHDVLKTPPGGRCYVMRRKKQRETSVANPEKTVRPPSTNAKNGPSHINLSKSPEKGDIVGGLLRAAKTTTWAEPEGVNTIKKNLKSRDESKGRRQKVFLAPSTVLANWGGWDWPLGLGRGFRERDSAGPAKGVRGKKWDNWDWAFFKKKEKSKKLEIEGLRRESQEKGQVAKSASKRGGCVFRAGRGGRVSGGKATQGVHVRMVRRHAGEGGRIELGSGGAET